MRDVEVPEDVSLSLQSKRSEEEMEEAEHNKRLILAYQQRAERDGEGYLDPAPEERRGKGRVRLLKTNSRWRR